MSHDCFTEQSSLSVAKVANRKPAGLIQHKDGFACSHPVLEPSGIS